jgi:hypothetical protein
MSGRTWRADEGHFAAFSARRATFVIAISWPLHTAKKARRAWSTSLFRSFSSPSQHQCAGRPRFLSVYTHWGPKQVARQAPWRSRRRGLRSFAGGSPTMLRPMRDDVMKSEKARRVRSTSLFGTSPNQRAQVSRSRSSRSGRRLVYGVEIARSMRNKNERRATIGSRHTGSVCR